MLPTVSEVVISESNSPVVASVSLGVFPLKEDWQLNRETRAREYNKAKGNFFKGNYLKLYDFGLWPIHDGKTKIYFIHCIDEYD